MYSFKEELRYYRRYLVEKESIPEEFKPPVKGRPFPLDDIETLKYFRRYLGTNN